MKWRRRLALAALCLLVLLAAAVPAARAAAKEKKTVRVGWYESTFCHRDKFGRRCGIAYEYQQRIAIYTGWEYEYVEDSWPNLLEMLKAGEIDLLSDVSLTEERREEMLFPDLPMGAEAYYIFADADNNSIDAGDPSTLNNRKVGVNAGSVQAGFLKDWARRNGVLPKIVELTGEEAESMDMLARGELDAYVSIDSFGAKDRCIPVCKVGSSDFYFAVNKQRPDLLKELNAAMNGILEEDPYYNQKMYDEYVYITKTNAFLKPSREEWLAAHGTIRVGYRDDYLPFCAVDKATGELTGALRDYLARAANCMKNAELRFEAIPYHTMVEALEALEDGAVDCVFPVNLSTYDAEQMGVLMTDPAMSTEMLAVMRETDSRGISRDRDVTVAVNAGNLNTETFLREKFPDWTVARYSGTDACITALATEEADCTLISYYRINALESQMAKNRLYSVPTGETMRLSFATKRDERELFFILNKTVILTKSEDMETALASYSRISEKITLLRFMNDNWIAVVAFITVVFGVILLLMRQKLTAEREAGERQRQVDRERIERQREQEEMLRRELRQQRQLDSAIHMAYTDPLTGVKSKQAYVEAESRLDQRIEGKAAAEFGVVVFDLNDLKRVNDTQGHELGDQYIKDGCRLICTRFKHSPVFRVGGDEFVVILEGSDYLCRAELLDGFEQEMDENAKTGGIVISSGCALYEPARDDCVRAVFERADELMYRRKRTLKSIQKASAARTATI